MENLSNVDFIKVDLSNDDFIKVDLSNDDFIKVVQRVVDEKAKLEDLFIDQLFERFEEVIASTKTYKEKIEKQLNIINRTIDSKRRYHCAIGNVLNEAYEVLKYHNR